MVILAARVILTALRLMCFTPGDCTARHVGRRVQAEAIREGQVARRQDYVLTRKHRRSRPHQAWPERSAMTDIPDDIFTEPEDVDPDTLANLGPLTRERIAAALAR